VTFVGGRLCDEATSALDSTTEGEILAALRSLAQNRTAIFIAHRLTTAMQCDEVNSAFLIPRTPKKNATVSHCTSYLTGWDDLCCRL